MSVVWLTAGLVISLVFLSIGTLKSTRIKTFSPLSLRSVIASLFARDMVAVSGCTMRDRWSDRAMKTTGTIKTSHLYRRRNMLDGHLG